MTKEKKLEALYNAVNRAWDGAFDGWEWDRLDGKADRYLLGENHHENGFAFFVGSNEDKCSGLVWIEYEPDTDMIKLCIKNHPLQKRFQEDFKALFEKYSPFNMTVAFEKNAVPVLTREEKVEPKGMLTFFNGFKKAYKENYSLFYIFAVGEKEWYEEFNIEGSDC